jgi:hypothetical protein
MQIAVSGDAVATNVFARNTSGFDMAKWIDYIGYAKYLLYAKRWQAAI